MSKFLRSAGLSLMWNRRHVLPVTALLHVTLFYDGLMCPMAVTAEPLLSAPEHVRLPEPPYEVSLRITYKAPPSPQLAEAFKAPVESGVPLASSGEFRSFMARVMGEEGVSRDYVLRVIHTNEFLCVSRNVIADNTALGLRILAGDVNQPATSELQTTIVLMQGAVLTSVATGSEVTVDHNRSSIDLSNESVGRLVIHHHELLSLLNPSERYLGTFRRVDRFKWDTGTTSGTIRMTIDSVGRAKSLSAFFDEHGRDFAIHKLEFEYKGREHFPSILREISYHPSPAERQAPRLLTVTVDRLTTNSVSGHSLENLLGKPIGFTVVDRRYSPSLRYPLDHANIFNQSTQQALIDQRLRLEESERERAANVKSGAVIVPPRSQKNESSTYGWFDLSQILQRVRANSLVIIIFSTVLGIGLMVFVRFRKARSR